MRIEPVSVSIGDALTKFLLYDILKHRHTFHILRISIFLDVKAACDSADRAVLWFCFSLEDVGEIQSLC